MDLHRFWMAALCVTGTLQAGAIAAGAPEAPPSASALHHAAAGAGSERALLIRLRAGVRAELDANALPVVLDPSGGISAGATLLLRGAALDGVGVRPLLAQPAARPDLAALFGLDRDVVVQVSSGVDVARLCAALSACVDSFEVVEPAGVGTLSDNAVEAPIPSDPFFGYQYALYNAGQGVQGQAGVLRSDVHAIEAWQQLVAKRDVVVAIIDSGVQPHPDLPTLLTGWNVPLQSTDTGDEFSSHGTHVAGIIGARTNNALGIAGLVPSVRLLPVKATNLFGSTSADWVAQGIVWAADHGANVINVSIGFTTGSTALHSAVQYAVASGCVVVASTGNTPGAPVAAPANYPEVVAVGATDNRDVIASFSATGPEVDMVAPGWQVLSTWHQSFAPSTYQYRSGTSQAAPMVAGVAAMVMQAGPKLTPGEVRLILALSCDDLGPPGWDPAYGAGRINAERAVRLASSWGAPASGSGAVTSSCRADVNHSGTLTNDDFFFYIELFVGGDPRADFAPPMGVINTDDFFAFNVEFVRGCVRP